jgi:hypothetical protein
MPKSLHELVSAALNDATSNIKMASADDVPHSTEPAGDDFLDSLLGNSESRSAPAATAPQAATPKTASKASSESEILDLAAYAEKVASALDRAAVVVTKLANSPLSAPGPVVSAAGHDGPSAHPKPVTTAHKYLERPTPSEDTQDNPNGVKTNKDVYTDPDWTKNKEAALRLVQAKVASAEQFHRMGQFEAATQLLEEAQKIKLAADPSSPQAKLPGHSDSFKIPTELSGYSHKAPDNAGAIAITKAQARNPTTAEAKERLMESPKVDNAVAAHLKTTTGVKTSAAEVLREKKAGIMDAQAEMNRATRESSALQGGVAGTVGAAAGGALGGVAALAAKARKSPTARRALDGELYRNPRRGQIAKKLLGSAAKGAIPGALLGGAGLGALGVAGARAERRMSERLREEGRRSKTASLEETQAYLDRLVTHARSKTASAEEIERVSLLIEYANTHGLEAVHSLMNQEQA